MHQAGVPALVRRTADGELELAFVDLPLGPQGNRVRAEPLGTEALELTVAAGDRLAERRRVRLIDLADRDFAEYRPDSSLRTSIDAACNAVGLHRRIACEVDSVADLIDIVAQGVGVSILPPGAVRISGGRLAGVATDPAIPRELAFVTARDREPSPAAKAFLTLLREDLASRAASRR
jgi:DNA-binding transcriptional LysR family regulator